MPTDVVSAVGETYNFLTTVVLRDGNSDTFLTEVEDNRGELQAWSVCPDGRAFRWTPDLAPETVVPWEDILLDIWEFSEKYVWGERGTSTAVGPLGAIRWVSINRLTRNPAWKERQSFL